MKKILTCLIFITTLANAKTFTHSTDDYRRKAPLEQALKLGFQSVEADIYFRKREVRVGSTMLTTIGTLKEVYLEPIKKRINTVGYIGKKGKPFYLWLDIQSDYRKLPLAVFKTLKEYDFLTIQKKGKIVKKGPVTVIITGRDSFKESFFKLSDETPALKEDNTNENNQGAWVSIDWLNITNWNGIKSIDKKLKRRLIKLVDDAHKLGKKIRFKNVPENEVIWSELVSINVDLIGAQNLIKLSKFLKTVKNNNL